MDKKLLIELKEGIDRTSPIPLYYQIETKLDEMIEQGFLQRGENIPGEAFLGRFLGINHLTVRKGLSGLVEKGLINRTRRAGTFVSKDINLNKESPSIGFFYFKEAEIIMAKAAEYIQDFLTLRGFDLKILGFNKDYFDQLDLYQEIQQMNLKGGIITLLDTEDCKKNTLELEKREFPYVRFGNNFLTGELKAPLVRGNDSQAIRDALEYLWNMEHRKIGLVCNYRGWETEQEYQSFYAQNGGFEPHWCISVEFSGPFEQWKNFPGPQIARGYLETNPELTAIVVEHPAVCIDLLRQTVLMGKKIPEELSIISLRDWEGLNAVIPPITAMRIPTKEMAEKSAQFLLDIIKNGFPKKEKVIKIPHLLIERESVTHPVSSLVSMEARL
ncbi:MAG: substrate-binding domain-containing protein [Candidatus Omnitrophota bacterium]